MKNLKHSPGQWQVKEQGNDPNDFFVIDENNRWFFSLRQNGEFNRNELNANAQLIAAAPELLETLIELFDLLEEHEPIWYLRGHFNHARKAINKATSK